LLKPIHLFDKLVTNKSIVKSYFERRVFDGIKSITVFPRRG